MSELGTRKTSDKENMKTQENLVATDMQEIRAEHHSGLLKLELSIARNYMMTEIWTVSNRAIADPDSWHVFFLWSKIYPQHQELGIQKKTVSLVFLQTTLGVQLPHLLRWYIKVMMFSLLKFFYCRRKAILIQSWISQNFKCLLDSGTLDISRSS